MSGEPPQLTNLLLKSAADTVVEVQQEMHPRSQPTKKKGKPKMGQKKKLRQALAQSELAKAATPPMNAAQAITLMKSAADDAERAGDMVRAEGIRQELCTFKMQLQERDRERRGRSSSRYGPNSAELFSRVGTLPDDVALGGL